MKKLSREEIINIGNEILNESDIVAKHGTSVDCAISIIDTGFKFQRTSMVVQQSKSVTGLCVYGWKENRPGDATNVVISIPKDFIMKLLNLDENGYQKWIEYIKKNNYEENFIYSLANVHFEGVGIAPLMCGCVPNEFIKGFFAFCDNTNYLKFLNNKEEALDHLTFVPNPSFYTELTREKQEEVVNRFKPISDKLN